MRPKTWRCWAAAAVVLLVAGASAAQFLFALSRAIYLVDIVPGADAGIATSPALAAARTSASYWGIALLSLGVATGAVVLVQGHRRLA